MPCDSSYLEPTEYEKESNKICKLLAYLLNSLGRDVPDWIAKGAESVYGTRDKVHELAAMLCLTITNMTQQERDIWMYDAHKPMARKLASWWERHERADRARIAEEKRKTEDAEIEANALKKLTAKERKILGL